MSNASANPLDAANETLGEWGDLESSNQPESETETDNLSELSSLEDDKPEDAGKSTAKDKESTAETPAETKPPADPNIIEFKALGKTHQVPKPTDAQLPILLSKAYGADRKLAEANAKATVAEAKLAEADRKIAAGGKSVDVERASRLLTMGHSREAILEMTKALGVDGAKALEAFLEDERTYAKADPSQRLLIDSERKTRSADLAKMAAEEKLKDIDAKAEAASEANRAAQYSGYIKDSFDRYDLSQWIENTEVANSLNQTLKDSAMNVLSREQRKRESANQPDLTNQEIRAIVAKQAKLLHGSYTTTQANQNSATAVDAQSKTAEQKMQAAVTTKTATQDEKLNAAIKRGASPTEIASIMFGTSKKLF